MKVIRSIVLITCLFVSTLKPFSSKAGISLSYDFTAGIVLGGITAAGSLTGVFIMSGDDCHQSCVLKVIPLVLLSGFGLAILDHRNESVVFKNFSHEEGKKWGLTESETLAFNDELDEINQTFDFISMEVIHHHDQSPNVLSALSYMLWQDSMDQFSPEAQSALKKIGNKFK